MTSRPHSDLYGDVEKVRFEIYKSYGITENGMKENVETLKKWCESQPHLPEIPSDYMLETFLILNKLSIEKSKSKLDMYYTIRTLIPEIYENSNPKLPHMQKSLNTAYWVPLSTISNNLYRVLIFKLADTDPDNFDPTWFLVNTINQVEIRFREDYALGDILIYDLEGIKLGHFTKVTPAILAKINAIVEKVFSARLGGIHFLNAPSFIDTFVRIVRTVVKPKIAERIHVHKNLDSLYKLIPKENLPKDYGGNEKSLKELSDILKDKLLKEYQARFDLLDELRVDENLRPEKLKNDEVLGFHGNFKQLSVD